MEKKSLSNNLLMYILRLMSGIIFTILVFPHVAKILGPANIGKIQYSESIMNYFILFINIGIPIYGSREVARLREDKEALSQLMLELLFILISLALIMTTIYVVMVNNVSALQTNKTLHMIFTIGIFFNFMSLDWFFIGIENQKYITIRSVLSRVLLIVPIFIFLKNENDYLKYALIYVVSLSGVNIFNFIRVFNYVEIDIKKIKKIKISKHLKTSIIFFSTSLAITISYNIDSLMIGNISGAQELGYYSLASKLGRMPVVFITAISTVLSPRICNYVANGEKKNYLKYVNIGLDSLLIISIPITIGIYLLAPEIIEVLSGETFQSSVPILRIYSFLIIILGMSYFSGSLVFTPNGLEKKSLLSLIIAVVFNVIFNFIMIPKYGAIGAAIVTILSELVGLLVRFVIGKALFKQFNFFSIERLKVLFASIFMAEIILVIKKTLSNSMLTLLISVVFGILFYLLFLIFVKEKNIYLAFKILKVKINNLRKGVFYVK